MGFSIYYRSTKPLSNDRAAAIRSAARNLGKGRAWLSCEPLNFFAEQEDGRLWGGSKPNLNPHSDDVASFEREGLPDGTVLDLLDELRELSEQFAVDWEISHDYEPRPIGFIRSGQCDAQVRQQLEAVASLAELMLDPSGFAGNLDELTADDEDDEPPTLRLWKPP